MEFLIRNAVAEDLPAILEIVNYSILNTTAIYDYEPKSPEQQNDWLSDKQSSGFPVIVLETAGKVAGFGSYGTFRVKAAYQFTVEHSVYVSEEFHGRGFGKALLAELISLAKAQDIHTMIGCIDADNSGSIAFHKKFGFTETAVLKQVGYKFGRWLDLSMMQLILQ